jgi:hypothetical protein
MLLMNFTPKKRVCLGSKKEKVTRGGRTLSLSLSLSHTHKHTCIQSGCVAFAVSKPLKEEKKHNKGRYGCSFGSCSFFVSHPFSVESFEK